MRALRVEGPLHLLGHVAPGQRQLLVEARALGPGHRQLPLLAAPHRDRHRQPGAEIDLPRQIALEVDEQRGAGDRLAPEAHDVGVDLLLARADDGQLGPMALGPRDQRLQIGRARGWRDDRRVERDGPRRRQADQQAQPGQRVGRRQRRVGPRPPRDPALEAGQLQIDVRGGPALHPVLDRVEQLGDQRLARPFRLHPRPRQLRPDVGGAHPRHGLGARHLLAQLGGAQRAADDRPARRALAADLDRLLGVQQILDPVARGIAPRPGRARHHRVAGEQQRRADLARRDRLPLGARAAKQRAGRLRAGQRLRQRQRLADLGGVSGTGGAAALDRAAANNNEQMPNPKLFRSKCMNLSPR